MNQASLIGRVGHDPETRTFDDGGKIATCSLATTTKWKNKDGEKQSRTEWHRLVFRGGLCAVVEQYIHKGDQIAVIGEIRYREYDGENGKVKVTEIHVSDMEMLGGSRREATTVKEEAPVDEFPNSPQPPEDDLPF